MKKIICNLKRYPLLYRSLKKGYEIFSPPLCQRLERILGNIDDIFFIQVGSNDGRLGDPIHRLIVSNHTWNGIFIEPVSYLFNRLKHTYDNASRFIFENVAISERGSEQKFFYLPELKQTSFDVPEWIDQLGSFDKGHILKHLYQFNLGFLKKYIVEDMVPCVSFSELCRRNRVKKIDLLHIDTEGYDFKILSQVDFKKYKPIVVLFENKHLPENELVRAIHLLKKEGYKLIRLKGDHLCIRKSSR